MPETPKIIFYTRNGVTIEFFRKDPVDKKLSFRIKGDEEATKKLLNNCKRKMVPERSIKHVISSLFKKIANGFPDSSPDPVQTGIDDTSRFVQMYQKKFGRSPKFLDTRDGVHSAELFGVKVITPNYITLFGLGKSKKLARLNLASESLKLPIFQIVTSVST